MCGNQIFGIGIDLIEVERVKNAICKNTKLLNKVFSEKEITYCNSKKNKNSLYICYAQRFAAKEAILKAFGVGVLKKIKLNEVEILNDESGKPYVNLLGNANLFALNNHINRIEISLSGVRDYATAFVIVFGS